MALAPQDDRRSRKADEQAYAMLAASLGYYQREARPFWWEHIDRLSHPIDDWRDQKDVFEVLTAEVVEPWATTGRQKKPRRSLRLTGQWVRQHSRHERDARLRRAGTHLVEDHRPWTLLVRAVWTRSPSTRSA